MSGSSTPARIMAPSRVRSSSSHSPTATIIAMTMIARRYMGKARHRNGRSRRARRRGDIERIAAPHHQAEVGGHKGQTERYQHLRELVAGQAAQQQPFGQRAERGHGKRRQDRREPKVQLEPEQADDEGSADIGAEHEQRAVRQIRNTHQPEDQGEARRQQKQQSTESDAVDCQHQPKIHVRSFPAL